MTHMSLYGTKLDTDNRLRASPGGCVLPKQTEDQVRHYKGRKTQIYTELYVGIQQCAAIMSESEAV